MNSEEIKSAVKGGRAVYWKGPGYVVIDGGKAGILIKGPGGHCVGLFKDSGAMVTGYLESDFSSPAAAAAQKAYIKIGGGAKLWLLDAAGDYTLIRGQKS